MATKKRQPDSPVASRLFKEFFRFSFYRAVALLERLNPSRKALGETLDPREEAVRFSVKPGLSFPPSDIANLTQPEGDGRPKMEVSFLGLIGPSGVLPYWFNDLAISRAQAKDYALIDFLDIFHHRFLTLFYLAWKRCRLGDNYRPGAQDRMSGHLLSLIGLGTPGMKGRLGISEESLIFCSGLLARQVPSASAVEEAVRYMAGADAHVHQFVERLIPVDPGDCTRLGSMNAELGVNTICGSYVRECQTKFRIHLGPVGYRHFLRFLPGGDLIRPIFALVRYMVGVEYEFEIRIFLKAGDVPGCILGAAAADAPRLGWSTWMLGKGLHLKEDPSVTLQEGDLN
ncbi:MAG TPA: type VI secretion system baseplate subunit TssG [Deltaproteobacteria bacterium]|nr:type VI secretion system baseplate subunit TssG [Deltaproteobacteria bacterium]HPR54436.1 type VI secretion system baseplate subunit TssG [Deltaproteobacteria bacterium]HXK46235.1 type VI secretion system baseplate subunit TssG [Deltaproteobacteria bacterium]